VAEGAGGSDLNTSSARQRATDCASRTARSVTRDFPNVDDEIAVVTNGRANPLETMSAFGGVLTTAQIRDVVEYTRAQLGK